jgi:hypothetical protein
MRNSISIVTTTSINPCIEVPNVGSEHLQALCHLENHWICHSAWSWRRDQELTGGNREEDAGWAGKNFRMGETSETREKSGGARVRGPKFPELRTQNSELQTGPVALTLHERRFTRKNNGSAIAAEAFVNEAG